MRALVLGSVAGVAEGLVAAWVLTQVGLLPRVAPQVDLQVLKAGESLLAALKLQQQNTQMLLFSRDRYTFYRIKIFLFCDSRHKLVVGEHEAMGRKSPWTEVVWTSAWEAVKKI